MIGTKHILLYTLVVSLVLMLSSCKSKVKMPAPPPQMPSIPSSKPPSSMPSIPSLPSKPSIPSASPPSIQPPSARPPSPSMPSQSKGSDKSKSKGEKGKQKKGEQKKGDRQQAGEDLQKAGEQIAQAGGQLGDGSSSDDLEPEFPVEDSDKIGDQPPDVLMPESDATSDSDELVFEESESSSPSSSASESSEAAENAEQSANEAIQAAQEALEEAGIALQTAGQAVSEAESEEALNEAEQLLSNARIKIILAEQDLGVLGDSEIDEETSADINAAINEANVYLVVATQSILNARTGLPEFPGGTIVGNAKEKGSTGELDEELEQSLIIFDGELEAARATIIDTTSAPTGDIVGIQTDRPSGNATYPEEGEEEDEEQGGEQSGEQDEEDQIASAKPSLKVPEGIPSAQGDDIVAHQLREAATAETDPELKEKLWEEYRRYKSGL